MFNSWGNIFTILPNEYQEPAWQDQISIDSNQTQLACGLRRSYGDVCLIEKGKLIDVANLNKIISFDNKLGTIQAEAGTSLKQILDLVIPQGWILPVLPGTQFVTLGGAIANDVHGKNHHSAGSFGCHVKSFTLKRSEQENKNSDLLCSLKNNLELFQATIGGLGLTGIITEATIQLKPIPSEYLDVETLVFENLETFHQINKQSEQTHEYTVAWLDCVSQGENFSRGIYMRANFSENSKQANKKKSNKKPIAIPCFFPGFILNKLSIKLFNKLYFYKQSKQAEKSKLNTQVQHYTSFFFPLDNILSWNKIYGKKGFYQYQCVLPENNQDGMKEILNLITQSGQASFLSVLKTFGNKKSPGLLSFPQPGLTLALDFANKSKVSLELFNQLNKLVLKYNGKLYPAKDAQMPGEMFNTSYQKPLEQFIKYIDPNFSSHFWTRVTSTEQT